jgi:hypothetical protein
VAEITVTVANDGQLISRVTQFAPGDVIHFQAGEPLYLLVGNQARVEVQAPIVLNEFSAVGSDGVVRLASSGGFGVSITCPVVPSVPGR